MVAPINSPIYVPSPEDGGGSDPKPGGGAADPTLKMLWENGYVPGFNEGFTKPAPPPVGTGPGPAAPPPAGHASFSVDLSTVYSVIVSGASTTSGVVDAYNALKAKVDAVVASGTFWGQQFAPVGTWYDNSGMAGGMGPIPRTGPIPDKGVQKAAQKFAPIINPELQTALRQVADAVEIYGVYLARLDLAGQAYASADHGSILPEVAPRPKA
ncbi:hypothetical protein ACFU6K_14255 [Kitasatospora sp. NPDC057512]|uniref:hypothetical protein n=1 Tax=Kitasatospora sp. NPDC057512 TaxID=3346154 RepID=UPI0036C2A05E